MVSKLFNVRCDNCGAEYRINSRGEMNCPFCGSKVYLNDKDWDDYQKARDEMLVKDKMENDIVNADGDVLHKWNNELSTFIEARNGKSINIHYFYEFNRPNQTVYVGNRRVAIIYNDEATAQRAITNVDKLQYPSADIKGLSTFFPVVNLTTTLKDGRYLVVLEKAENVYPLAIFNPLDAKNTAWMVSRLENFGCLFEFNGVGMPIELEDVYINPKTHYVYLFGGWENMTDTNTKQYLKSIRTIMKDKTKLGTAPKQCIDFFDGNPADNAYTDFDNWDTVLETGFNGHNFHHFTED